MRTNNSNDRVEMTINKSISSRREGCFFSFYVFLCSAESRPIKIVKATRNTRTCEDFRISRFWIAPTGSSRRWMQCSFNNFIVLTKPTLKIYLYCRERTCRLHISWDTRGAELQARMLHWALSSWWLESLRRFLFPFAKNLCGI